jgi:parallel beta-helix repeat protein
MKSRGLNISSLFLGSSLTALFVIAGSSMLVPGQVNAGSTPTLMAQIPASATVVYVNPVIGQDRNDFGVTEEAPYKTITFALLRSQSNTVIKLAPGSYTKDTGETFPLMLKPGVILLGNESTKGQGTVIIGGGYYTSRTFARQDVTILAENNTTITGVTVTNPNQRGTAVWVESTNPTIKNNTFTNSVREGVFVTGTGNPKIENNIFFKNGGNGVSVVRSAQGEIRNNTFENTGFGLAIGGESKPLVEGNQIIQNQDGLFISESAQPILRRNAIQNNKRDGIVATINALPNLGTNDSPGGNLIRNNARYDLNNATRSNTIVAVGNDIDQKRIVGAVDFVAASVTPPDNGGSVGSTAFRDVPTGYWAKTYIEALAAQNIIAGFPDGTFRPNEPVTRAQFATIINKALTPPAKRPGIQFKDVSSNFWAYNAIQEAYKSQFVAGYPDGTFKPQQQIPRVQALVALANGLNFTANSNSVLSVYSDAGQIPSYAIAPVAAATTRQLVVNYPMVQQLDPNREATRAEIAAFVYQALVAIGRAEPISSAYLVKAQ